MKYITFIDYNGPVIMLLEYKKSTEWKFHGRRPVGRLRPRWGDIRRDSSLLLIIKEWRTPAADRNVWRRTSEDARARRGRRIRRKKEEEGGGDNGGGGDDNDDEKNITLVCSVSG